MPKQDLVLNSRKKQGFTLIEILISLLFIGALLTILFASTGSLFVRRQSNQQSIAAKAASKEIERLRNLDFATLKTQGDLADPNCQTSAQNSDLTGLKDGRLCRNLYDQVVGAGSNPGAGTIIVGAHVWVYWKNDNEVNSAPMNMETYIYQNGL